jgi:hypothetical protein
MVWTQDGDTCESDLSNTACEIIMLDMDEKEMESDIRVYPVPASNWLTLEADQEMERIELINLTGEEVKAVLPSNRTTNIDVSGFQPGIYILNIKTKSHIYHRKILVF